MPLSFLGAFAIALCVSVALMPLMERLGLRLGAVSRPGGRNVHQRATPRFGGPAIFVAFFVPVVIWYFLETSVSQAVQQNPWRIVGLLIGASMMLVLGAWDDMRSVRARTKLLVQTGAALVAFACEYRIDVVRVPFLGDVALGWAGVPLLVLWVVGVVNCINLIDGLDGLAAGIVFLSAVTNFAVAFIADANFVALLMVSMLGAVLGFLFFNFNPARIFMGDSGSYFLGYVLALTAISAPFQKASTAVSLLVPIVSLGVPIVDTLFAMFRRILERRPIFSPDRGHLHHRLLDMGITHRRAVLIIYGVSVVLTVAAIAISIGRDWQVGLAMLVAAVVIAGLVRSAGFFGQAARPSSGPADPARVTRLRRALPSALLRLERAESEAAVWEVLRAFARDALVEAVEVVDVLDNREAAVLQLGGSASAEKKTQARFTIGDEAVAVADLRFFWGDLAEDSNRDCSILLQLLVDVVATALLRVGSARAPRAATSASVSA